MPCHPFSSYFPLHTLWNVKTVIKNNNRIFGTSFRPLIQCQGIIHYVFHKQKLQVCYVYKQLHKQVGSSLSKNHLLISQTTINLLPLNNDNDITMKSGLITKLCIATHTN